MNYTQLLGKFLDDASKILNMSIVLLTLALVATAIVFVVVELRCCRCCRC